MNKRFRRGLFLLAVAMFPPLSSAQAQDPVASSSRTLSAKPSHYDLPGGLDLEHPEQMMAQRLQELYELHQLQDQVQDLLKDPDFLKNIENFSEQDLQKLRQKMQTGKGLSQDPKWNELLKQAVSQKKFDPRSIETLDRLLGRSDARTSPSHEPNGNDRTPPEASTRSSPPVDPSSAASPPSEKPPEPSLLDKMQQETTKWMLDHVDEVGGDVLESITEAGATREGAPLADLLRTLQQPDFSGMNISQKALGLSEYLPRLEDLVRERHGPWEGMRSLLRDAPVPSLPRFNVSPPSLHSAPTVPSGRGAPAFLSLLLFGILVLLLVRMAARAQGQTGSKKEQWKLGPWPVAPDALSTRQDVIRAFEYLALLQLGPAAGTCHHRELAERLGEQDRGNPARRQAAELLAGFYEQARYAPAEAALSTAELTHAQQALCFLAGVTGS